MLRGNGEAGPPSRATSTGFVARAALRTAQNPPIITI